MLRSLERFNIYEEARKAIPISDLFGTSESSTIHDIVTQLYEHVWKELMFNQTLWVDGARTNLEVLAVAAKSVSNAKSTPFYYVVGDSFF